MDTKALADAKSGIGLLNITRVDSRAWDTLKAVCPKYQSDYFTLNQRHRKATTTTTNESIGICVYIKKDQEAYLDEFVSYHLSLGFAAVYIYDSSDKFWLKDWGKEKDGMVHSIHFPDNATTPHGQASAYTNCTLMYGDDHEAMVYMELNDFFMFPKDNDDSTLDKSPINTLLVPGAQNEVLLFSFIDLCLVPVANIHMIPYQ